MLKSVKQIYLILGLKLEFVVNYCRNNILIQKSPFMYPKWLSVKQRKPIFEGKQINNLLLCFNISPTMRNITWLYIKIINFTLDVTCAGPPQYKMQRQE